ncbi:hypothetical protein, partial [Candidatus Magnetobacterium casense]
MNADKAFAMLFNQDNAAGRSAALSDTLVPKEYHVGDGWRFECKTCHYQVGIDHRAPETCPGCGRAGWWYRCSTGDVFKRGDWMMDTTDLRKHLTTPSEAQETVDK